LEEMNHGMVDGKGTEMDPYDESVHDALERMGNVQDAAAI
jgi:hypothetical protein